MDPVERGFERERRRNAQRLLGVRVVATAAWLTAALAFGWIPQRPYIFGYLVASIVIWVVARRFPRLLDQTLWAIPVVDLPLLIAAQSASLGGSDENPLYILGMNNAVLAVITVASAFVLNPAVTWAVASVAVLLQVGLVLSVESLRSPSRVVGAILIQGTLAGTITVLLQQVTGLVRAVATEKAARERLQRYFSPAVADRIVEAGGDHTRGEHREITVLVADIRGFTDIAANTDAEVVVAWLDAYFAAMVEVIFHEGGTLDKFMGDGLLAWFGAPEPQRDHAARAVRCALGMQVALAKLNAVRVQQGLPALKVGIGVHSGSALVGDIGPSSRREYTAIGETVNLAARIESLTKEVGVAVLVSGAAQRAAGNSFAWQALPAQVVRGVSTPVEVFAVG